MVEFQFNDANFCVICTELKSILASDSESVYNCQAKPFVTRTANQTENAVVVWAHGLKSPTTNRGKN